ncbi:MAG: hypothetical protein ACRDTG_17040 [Pseudonocardiaceae bacterium]
MGKTFLLTRFAEGKRHVYFTATRQDSERRQVERYALSLREQLGEDVADLIGGGFSDWEAALKIHPPDGRGAASAGRARRGTPAARRSR